MFYNFLGRETGEILSAPVPSPNQGPSNILWESKEQVWEINWTSLKHELVNWEAPWNVMKLGDFIKSVLISLMLFLASSWDVLSDAQVAHLYIAGNNYDYYFSNQTDPTISELNCTYKGQVDGHLYRYNCFQRDTLLGFLTLFIMLLPGALLSFLLFHGLKHIQYKTCKWILAVIMSPILSICFPILLFLIKVTVNIGEHYTKCYSFLKFIFFKRQRS